MFCRSASSLAVRFQLWASHEVTVKMWAGAASWKNSLLRWLTHMAGKLVLVVCGRPQFPLTWATPQAAGVSLQYGNPPSSA